MRISRLRLIGFKSFAEATELVIEPGLTGVVGPNGCGKSNLLEALRWVMGETSHKSMRAASMDDVIFSGTTQRPARNSAEVTMILDNTRREAPAEFNASDTIEITRRIERDAGSAYRVNGKEIRAREIKVMFEDAATGARSPALVRQGQISEIVNAKPEQRRRVLEDAAGIAGLHSRRHEAELRLRAAEVNLARVADVLGGLDGQIDSLKRQARQARRYKELSAELRRAEALLLHLSWTDADASVTREESNLAEALDRHAAACETEQQAFAAEMEIAEGIAPLREAEALKVESASRLRLEHQSLERDAQRAADAVRDLVNRARDLEADLARERQLVEESRETLDAIETEVASLAARDAAAQALSADAENRRAEIESRSAESDARFAELTRLSAETKARLKTLDIGLTERATEVGKLTKQIAAINGDIRTAVSRAPDAEELQTTTEHGQGLVRQIAEIETAALAAEDASRRAANDAKRRREDAQKIRLTANAFSTERDTLARMLAPANSGLYPPVTDELRVAPGYEVALGAALGDDLDAPTAPDAPIHWRHLEGASSDPSLPADVEPLLLYVQAPHELARRLRQIGIVTREQGALLQRHLRPGQRLVSRDGDLWRWDGFVAASGGATAAAQRLATKNRLLELDRKAAEILTQARDVIEAEKMAADAAQRAEADERHLRGQWRQTQAELAQTRERLTVIERQARETETRLSGLRASKAKAEESLADAQMRHADTEAQILTMSAGDDLEPALHKARAEAEDARRAMSELRVELATLERERDSRASRSAQLAGETARSHMRRTGAEKQIAALGARLAEVICDRDRQQSVPEKIAVTRAELEGSLAAAEAERAAVSEKLGKAEAGLKSATQALRQAQENVSAAREAKARVEARLDGARQRRQDEARRIRETLGVSPEDCLALAELAAGAALPVLGDVDRHLTRLRADRERIGGVNLQADEDLQAVSAQTDALRAELDDVQQAIAKLRTAISQLNREGKKRLEEAFTTVNGHFERLFTTLFGGGEARLEMIASEEDPLEGGLEIIAKPPGKKPATLSLLSGGEQTLTALSLIFAVFLTNPSPICVLDEVDAPLDDANVDRFCRLMEKMAEETETRFLTITHHPMTMSRMNRLFGVTMAERGVSQLVSVDLETAQSFREAS